MPKACLGLGSNASIEDEMLCRARILINVFMGTIKETSMLYRTSPWGMSDQKDFINQAVTIYTNLSPEELYQSLLHIEKILKKHKTSKYGPRNIDIDILLYDDVILNSESLQIPHPRMHERNFVLIPLTEIAGTEVHPVFKKTISALASECTDKGSVTRIQQAS